MRKLVGMLLSFVVVSCGLSVLSELPAEAKKFRTSSGKSKMTRTHHKHHSKKAHHHRHKRKHKRSRAFR